MRLRFSLLQWFGIITAWIAILAVVGINENAYTTSTRRLLQEVEREQMRYDGFERWLRRHDEQEFCCRHLRIVSPCGASAQEIIDACKWRKSLVLRRYDSKQELDNLRNVACVGIERQIQNRVRSAAIIVPLAMISVLLVPMGLLCRHR